jgi:hypothetical protein
MMKGTEMEPTNTNRAEWAQCALEAFADQCCTDGPGELDADPGTILADLLCDLMHWADVHGEDFAAQLERGRGHYDHETDEEDGADELHGAACDGQCGEPGGCQAETVRATFCGECGPIGPDMDHQSDCHRGRVA